MNKSKLNYVAGFFDGEGYIAITKNYQLRIGVSNTNRDILEWLKIHFGGTIQKRPWRHCEAKTHKPAYLWRLGAHQSINLLKQIYPYLKLKRLQTEIAFELRKTFDTPNPGKIGVLASTLMKRLELRNSLSVLNKRGLNN